MITFSNKQKFDTGALEQEVKNAVQVLTDGTGDGSAYRGWLDLPTAYRKTEEYQKMKSVANEIRETADALVVIGIGGSYLGARAAITALTRTYHNENIARTVPAIYYAGKNISATELADLVDILKGKNVYLNIISKSGTTLEPALAFRVLHNLLEKQHGTDGARERIIATTDGAQGALHDYAVEKGYQTFIVPNDVGGRYSVLTPVGLLPIAVAGIDIDMMMDGAAAQRELCAKNFEDNDCLQYAAARTQLYRTGTIVDVFASYEPKFAYMAEWWKQLFGESEGKEQKGLFPASMMFTTDLHSLGQYMQEGTRMMCETVLSVAEEDDALSVPVSDSTADGLDAHVGTSLGTINKIAEKATIAAHEEGGVPVINLSLDTIDAYNIGAAFYFFEYACAISGYMLGVNPFNQLGVEVYKKKMYELLEDKKVE